MEQLGATALSLTFSCSLEGCKKHYNSSKVLRKHQRLKHAEIAVIGKLMCPITDCDNRFPQMNALCEHVRRNHRIPKACMQLAYFSSFDEFKEWKSQLERKTASKFVKHCAPRTDKFKRRTYLYCHRSGHSSAFTRIVAPEKRRRAIKRRGLNKMRGTCTAHMSVTSFLCSNQIVVNYCSHHVGHGLDLGPLQPNLAIRSEALALRRQGVSIGAVMDKIRDLADPPGGLKWNCLQPRSGRIRYSADFMQKNDDDRRSVDEWVEQLESLGSDSPVVLYKGQGVEPDYNAFGLTEADFMLCLQTTTQRRLMVKFGHERTVCLINRRRTNQYDYHVVSILVVDDSEESYPVAFMICNEDNELFLRVFFSAIQSRLPEEEDFTASLIITDDASQYIEAWVSVFGPTKWKLCPWHFDRLLRKAVKKYIPRVKKKIEIYYMLRIILHETNEEDFLQFLNVFVQHVEPEFLKFASYFTSNFCTRVAEWAFCYREGSQTDTEAIVGSYCDLVKLACAESDSKGRLDGLLVILLGIARQKSLDRLIKVGKHCVEKVQEINKRHFVVLSELPAMDAGDWQVSFDLPRSQRCSVVPGNHLCTCNLRCSECSCCPHMYQCSCADFMVRATVCKHVHTVHKLLDTTRTSQHGEYDRVVTKMCKYDNAQSDSTTPSVADLDETRRLIVSRCQQVMGVASVCSDTDALSRAMAHLKTAELCLQNAQSISHPDKLSTLSQRNENKGKKRIVTDCDEPQTYPGPGRVLVLKQVVSNAADRRASLNDLAVAASSAANGVPTSMFENILWFSDGENGDVAYCVDC